MEGKLNIVNSLIKAPVQIALCNKDVGKFFVRKKKKKHLIFYWFEFYIRHFFKSGFLPLPLLQLYSVNELVKSTSTPLCAGMIHFSKMGDWFWWPAKEAHFWDGIHFYDGIQCYFLRTCGATKQSLRAASLQRYLCWDEQKENSPNVGIINITSLISQ